MFVCNCLCCGLQVFVCNSAKYSDLGQPFGYLKASTTLTCVNLFVMPYNYPVLLPLLGECPALTHPTPLGWPNPPPIHPTLIPLHPTPMQNQNEAPFVTDVSCFLFWFTISDDLLRVHKFKPTVKWRQSFENYLKTMPPYYIGVS